MRLHLQEFLVTPLLAIPTNLSSVKMNSLSSLINKYGSPDILIDHFDNHSQCYSIWGYEEELMVKNGTIFLNNEPVESENLLETLQEIIDGWKKNSSFPQVSCVGFVSYSFKNLLYPHINFKTHEHQTFPQLWFCKPKLIKKYSMDNSKMNINCSLSLLQDIPDLSSYERDINKIKSHLENGDVYQINYTNPQIYTSNGTLPFNIYLAIRSKAKPLFGMFLRSKAFSILSFSPEKFFEVKNNRISTFPIKGSGKRFSNFTLDKQSKDKLKNSTKDKAEHLMIVDLMRNDLGKVCKFGSVNVKDLYKIVSFETIHHMVSEIYGKLKKNITEMKIIEALFPGGSITGAPKESAMRIIDQIENYNRKIYTGSLGYIAQNGDMNFNIAIRTLLQENNLFEYGTGGGIVWDSLADNEREEAIQKTKILDSIVLSSKEYNESLL